MAKFKEYFLPMLLLLWIGSCIWLKPKEETRKRAEIEAEDAKEHACMEASREKELSIPVEEFQKCFGACDLAVEKEFQKDHAEDIALAARGNTDAKTSIDVEREFMLPLSIEECRQECRDKILGDLPECEESKTGWIATEAHAPLHVGVDLPWATRFRRFVVGGFAAFKAEHPGKRSSIAARLDELTDSTRNVGLPAEVSMRFVLVRRLLGGTVPPFGVEA